MIGTVARIIIGLILSSVLLIAVVVVAATDLVARDTRPQLRRRTRNEGPVLRPLKEVRT